MKKITQNTFNPQTLRASYELLIILKKALNIAHATEINIFALLEYTKKQNENEILLIKFLVNCIKDCPQIIKEQNQKIINAYKKPQLFKSVIDETDLLYKNNKTFKNFSNNIESELELDNPAQKFFVNSIIFELCNETISANIPLYTDIRLNLHLLQYWLKKNKKDKIINFKPIELIVINFFENGYTPQDIINYYPTKLTADMKQNFLKAIYTTLPKKLRVETICQAMALIFAYFEFEYK